MKEKNENKKELICFDELEPTKVEWLWFPYIPFGKVTILQGYPGCGKSTFILSLAAALSKGLNLPLSEIKHDPCNIVYQNTEDGLEDTVLPRFLLAQGDTHKLFTINEKERFVTFDDVRIAETIKATNCKLLVLDPLSAYIGDVNMNVSNKVRMQFRPLINVANETGCAIVIIAHLNKSRSANPMENSSGSGDIIGAVRSALVIAQDPDNLEKYYFFQQKNNLAKRGDTLEFKIEDGKIIFVGETDISLEAFCASHVFVPGRPDERVQDAVEIITEIMGDAPRKPAVLFRTALEEAGISDGTITSARKKLGITSKRMDGHWSWINPKCSINQ